MTERERLAAEYALRVLEGAELLEARGLLASDPAFAADVAVWEDRLAPLFAEIADDTPPDRLWSRIETALAGPPPTGEIVRLRHRLRLWQVGTGLAAAAALVLAILPRAPRAPPAASASLVASLEIAPAKPRIGITLLAGRREMLVSAAGIVADGRHNHELWVVPAQGNPRSLGVVQAGADRRVIVPAALSPLLDQGATIAVSVEPIGGSRTGLPTGPVIATAKLQEI